MASFTIAWTVLYGAAWSARVRAHLPAWIFPICGVAFLLIFSAAPAGMKLLASSLLLLYTFKAASLVESGTPLRPIPLAVYMTLWPGMDAESFARRTLPPDAAGPRFVRGLLSFYLGIAMVVGITLAPLPMGVALWGLLAAVLVTIHFGLSNLLTAGLQMVGFSVKPLFERPLASRSVNDFWTRRWNLAFVEMNRRLFMPSIIKRIGIKRAVLAAFLISGLLHELAISYPAGGGWGGPMLYFTLQAGLVTLERRYPRLNGPLWTWAAILLPLSLLFHTPFRETFFAPMLGQLQGIAEQFSTRDVAGIGLWIAAGLHLLILTASFQVPTRLKWKEELPLLSSFNRKLMWTYGLFIVLCIVAFSVLTFAFHGRFLAGDPVALGLAGFIAIFWLLRVIVDCFYFNHSDWPAGPKFVGGHALLTSLFAFLVLVYGAVGLGFGVG